MKKIVVAGTGYPEIISIIEEMKIEDYEYKLIGFLDDNIKNAKRNLFGYEILGGFDWIIDNNDVEVVNSIYRDCEIRYQTTQKLLQMGAKFKKIIHKSASVDPRNVGNGCIIGKNTILEKGSFIDEHCVILHNSVIAHDTTIGKYSFVGHNVSIQGFNEIGRKVFIGTGSNTCPNIIVNDGAKVGLNCSIVSSVTEDAVLIPSLPKRIK